MPHCDLNYSSDLSINAAPLLAAVEAIIQRHDAGAGDTKGRAYPAEVFYHTHMKVTVGLLDKPHRDAAFMAALRTEIFDTVAAQMPRPCWLSVDLVFSGANYQTEHLT